MKKSLSKACALGLVMLAGPGPRVDALAGMLRGTVTIAGRGAEPGDASGAVVWLEGAPGASPAPSRAVIDMREKVFVPAVTVVPAGSTVAFPNADPILHNVFSVSGGNSFDLGLYGRGEQRDVVMREPGVVRVFCNVHPQMEAFIVVAPGPWALASRDGSFELGDLPAGRYEVRVWDQRGGADGRVIDVEGDKTVTVDFRLDASTWRRRPHLDKSGRPYTSRERY